ncbi:MAG: hypothetical protein FWF63_03320 [Fibromonadales bacterium]|nr:hypothetical protein [Fibromonadales bacterium]
MAITLPSISGNQAISTELMYQFYDNKAITPQIRAAVQKRQEEEDKESGGKASASGNSSKFGPATRVDITDQIVRMNMAKNTAKTDKKEDSSKNPATSGTATTNAPKKPSRYDVLAEVKKSVAEREAAARKEKDEQLKAIADKVAAGSSAEG